jgi:hypothetical protein
MAMQYDVKQAHLNQSGILVPFGTRVKAVSFTGSATAGTLVLFDTVTAPVTTGTYARSGTTVTVTQTAHGLANGQVIGIDFGVGTGGAATNGNYVVTVLTDKTFTITTVATTAIVFTKFIFSCANTTSKFALGYKYEATAELPAFYFVKAEGNKDTINVPRINRLKVNSYNSGPYRALVMSEGRDNFSLVLPQVNSNYYKANNIPVIRNAESTVPIMAKGNQFTFKLIADSPFPTAFTSITWEGTYNNKGIQAL